MQATANALRAPSVTPENKVYIGYDPMADRRLWTSVILQAVQDALIDAHNAEWTTVQRDAHDAIKWLLYFNDEMVKVCSLAGASSDRVRASARIVLTPKIAIYEEKARLIDLECGLLKGADLKEHRKLAERYRKSVAIIKGGLN